MDPPPLEQMQGCATSQEGQHHRSDGPDRGRNSEGTWLNKKSYHSDVTIPLVCSLSGAPCLTLSDNMNVNVVMNVAATPNLQKKKYS